MSGKEVSNTGTNSAGNNYTSYTDGGYYYTNYNSSGDTTGRYYDTGSGHSFYTPTDTGKAAGHTGFHDNQNTGTRTYNDGGKK